MKYDIPEMIPPADYPTLGEAMPEYPRVHADPCQPLLVEAKEIMRLLDFHRAFTEYLNDRWNPGKSADVMRRYRAVVRLYEDSTA